MLKKAHILHPSQGLREAKTLLKHQMKMECRKGNNDLNIQPEHDSIDKQRRKEQTNIFRFGT
jgi:hypothetical protein